MSLRGTYAARIAFAPGFWLSEIGGISDRGGTVSVAVEKAIDFELPDHEGKAWRLADHLARGPVFLVFYRGDW